MSLERSILEAGHESLFIGEGLKSQKLQQLAQSSGDSDLLKKIYQETGLQLDKIPDESVKYADLAAARESAKDDPNEYTRQNAVYSALNKANISTYNKRRGYIGGDLCFWVLRTEKKSPSKQILKPGLLAVTDGESIISGEKSFAAPARGMSYIDRIKEYADEVYAIDHSRLRRGSEWGENKTAPLDASRLKDKRKEQKSGAVALIAPEKFAEWNRSNYERILAQRRPSEDLKAVANELNKLATDGMGAMDMTRMEGGKARVPGYTSRRGEPLSVNRFIEAVKDVWDSLNDAQRSWSDYQRQAPEDKKRWEDRGVENWELARYKQNIASAQKKLAELKTGKLDIWSD
jgi:hypothetical protein